MQTEDKVAARHKEQNNDGLRLIRHQTWAWLGMCYFCTDYTSYEPIHGDSCEWAKHNDYPVVS